MLHNIFDYETTYKNAKMLKRYVLKNETQKNSSYLKLEFFISIDQIYLPAYPILPCLFLKIYKNFLHSIYMKILKTQLY